MSLVGAMRRSFISQIGRCQNWATLAASPRHIPILLATMLFGVAAPVAASPKSVELTKLGAAQLKAGRNRQALNLFVKAVRADPRDAEARFFAGAAMNRLGRHGQALTVLRTAARLKSAHRDLGFEAGWAFVETGQARPAIRVLRRYERIRPGRGMTSLLLGRAYLALGQHAKALAALSEAMQRDPALAPLARYHASRVHAARGDTPAARRELVTLATKHPHSRITSQLARDLFANDPAGRLATGRRWSVIASTSGGWNSNVIGLGDGVLLPPDISDKSSGFITLTGSARYRLPLSAADTLVFDYSLRSDTYFTIPEANLVDNYGAVTWQRRFAPGWTGSVRGALQHSFVGGRSFRLSGSLRAAVAWRARRWMLTEVAYTFTASDYLINPIIQVQDRDGLAHTIALDIYADLPGTKFRLRFGASYTRNIADGGDFDFHEAGVQVGVSRPLFFGVTGEVLYAVRFARFTKPNSLSGLAGFASPRSDNIHQVTVQLSRPVSRWLRVFVRYDFVRANSNIRFYTYQQSIVMAGLVIRFSGP